MIGLGCVVTFSLSAGLTSFGALASTRHGHGPAVGFGWGVVAWFAAMAGYGVCLAVVDWWQRDKYPNRQPDPWWLVPLVCGIFMAATAAAAWLGMYAFRR